MKKMLRGVPRSLAMMAGLGVTMFLCASPLQAREVTYAPHARATQSYSAHITPDGRIFNAQGLVSGHVTSDGKVTDRHDLVVGVVKPADPSKPLSVANQARVLDASGYKLAYMNSKGLVSNERRERLGFIDKSGRVTDRHGYPVGYVPSDMRADGMLFLLRGHGLDLP